MGSNLTAAEGYLSCRREDVLLLRCPYKERLDRPVKPFALIRQPLLEFDFLCKY